MYIMKFSMSTYPLHHHHAMSRREELFHCHDNPIYSVTGDLWSDLWIELFANRIILIMTICRKFKWAAHIQLLFVWN